MHGSGGRRLREVKMGKFFGTDGFRGRAGAVLTAEQAFAAGRFLGYHFGAAQSKKCRAVIGKDTRRSSYMLEYALASGLAASGADAYMMHVATTPAVAYAARAHGFDVGIAISASHNPFEDNGIKLMNSAGEKLEDGVLDLLERYLALPPDGRTLPAAEGGGVGGIIDYVAGRNEYAAHLISLVPVSFSGCRVGLDCANGAAYNIARRVFVALGAKVFAVGCRPDGLNINRGCGSTRPGRLARLVRLRGLDIGFAFDGDGDRCICVDERGEVVDGDGILYVLACSLANGSLGSGGIVATVMSNSGLISSLGERGVPVAVCGVGDRAVYECMRTRGAMLGGEQSGHVILGKIENTGDGIVTALHVMTAMLRGRTTLSSLLSGLRLLPQRSVSVPVEDGARATAPDVAAAVARANKLLEGRGRLLVRPSGTESVVRIMAESDDGALCDEVCSLVARAVAGEGVCAE